MKYKACSAYRRSASATRVRRPPAELTLRQAELRRATGAPTVSMVLSQLRQHERAGVEDFMVMRTSCALHGRKMHTTGDFCSHVANPQVMTITSRESAGDGLCR